MNIPSVILCHGIGHLANNTEINMFDSKTLNPHKRPELSDLDHARNQKYVTDLTQVFLRRGIQLSENLKKILLEQAKVAGIWLQGLSPLVFNEFIISMTLALSNKSINDEQRIAIVIKHLNAKLDEENVFIRAKLQENSGRVLADEKNGVVKHLIDHVNDQSLPANYWLKAADIVALTEIVHKEVSEFHVVMPTDAEDAARAHDTARSLIAQGAKVVYVPYEINHNHWVLTIHGQNGFREYYNPRGDGKCGDYVVAKILRDAGQRAHKTFYPAGVTENSSAGAVRQTSVDLISKVYSSTQTVSTSSSASVSTAVTPSSQAFSAGARFKASALPKVTSASHVTQASSTQSKFVSKLEQMTLDLNRRADELIRKLQNLPAEKQKAAWEKFDQTEWKQVEQKIKFAANQGTHLGYGHLFSTFANKIEPTKSSSKATHAAVNLTSDTVKPTRMGL